MSFFKRGTGATSVLERNQLIIGAIGIVLVLGGSAFSLLLSSGVFSQTYTVTGQFADAAGLKDGDDVKVAGLDAGKISKVEIDEGSVQVEMKVSQSVELPADSTAEITIETLLGRKSVTLIAGNDTDLLEDGDEIPLDRTRTPVELVDLADTSVELLEASDAEALETFMEEVTEITRGKREQVTALIDGFGDTAAAIDLRRDELARLIDSLRILSTTFAERDDTLVNLIDNFDVVLANLEERTADIERLLLNSDSASHKVAALIERNRPTLDSTIENLKSTMSILDNHQVDLAALLSYLHDAVRGYQSVGYSQGVPNRWANIFVQSLGPAGIDAFFGPCGALDQAFDDLLGPDPRPCDEREQPDEEQGSDEGPLPRGNEGSEPTTGGTDDLLPGDVGDILDSVTGGIGVGDALRGDLLP